MRLLRFGEGETQSWLAEESEAHRRWLEEWRAGGFPADASGQRIAALAKRASRREAELIRDYCMLKTELVLAAERGALDRDRDVAAGERSRFRAAVRQSWKQLRKAMGRTGYAALRRCCPSAATTSGNCRS